MNKLYVIILFVLFAIGCNMQEHQSKTFTTSYVVNTITCLTRQGWVDYKTKYKIYDSYSGRNSMWRFKTISGETITNSSCYAKGL